MALTDNNDHYWKMDDAAPTADAIGSRTLTATGATSGATGKINEAYDFDGTSDKLAAGVQIPATDASFSISVWAKCDSYAVDETIINSGITASEWAGWQIKLTGATTAFCRVRGSGAEASVTGTMAVGSWYHYVITYNATTNVLEFWINGVSQGTDTNAYTTGSNDFIWIGEQTTGGNSWNGQIDEVSYWSRVITDAEIGELYNSGDGLQYPYSVAPTIPTAPSNLTATTASSTRIDLAWDDNSNDEDNFVLERSLTTGSGFAEIATPAADATSYPNTGLSASTQYFYRIKAVNVAGSSNYSNEDDATTDAAPPDPPDPDRGGKTKGQKELYRTYPHESGLAAINKHEGRQVNLVPQGNLGQKTTVTRRSRNGI